MTAQGLDEVFGALADPTRRAILARLASGDANVGELTAPFRMSQPAISRHLKVLERAGLISRRRRATARLSHLEAEPLREAAAWLVGYREYWEESYERLDALLSTLDRREASASTSRSRPGTSAKPKRKGVPDGQDQSHR
ncbi:MAG: helix-turn-helix transcriptional regulator [Chloroflexi bacterium]|nr:MAG: helix-turn-helix transcriptional regulator [Chloroflexota bacterium]